MDMNFHIHLNDAAIRLWHIMCLIAPWFIIIGVSSLVIDLLLTVINYALKMDPWRWRMQRGNPFCFWNILHFLIEVSFRVALIGVLVWIILGVLTVILIFFPNLGA